LPGNLQEGEQAIDISGGKIGDDQVTGILDSFDGIIVYVSLRNVR
jgi:hypothetical protein